MGHRKSNDIDLFTTGEFDAEKLLEKLESDFGFSMDSMKKNTVNGHVDAIKVDCIAHKYRLISKILEFEDLRIASVDDISAMKVNSIANGGSPARQMDSPRVAGNKKSKYLN